MAVFFLDSCQDYSSITQKYDVLTYTNLVTSGGRTGPQCLQLVGQTFYNFSGIGYVLKRIGVNRTNGILGFALKVAQWQNGFFTLAAFLDSTFNGSSWADTQQCALQYNGATGNFQFVQGSTVLAATSAPIFLAADGNWHYIEVRAVIDPASGLMELRVDGVVVLTVSGVNTRTSSNSSYSSFAIQSPNDIASGIFVCDIYMLDNSGASPWNTYLGDQKVFYAAATANAGPNQFTAQAAARANSTAYSKGAIAIDSNGNLQLCTTAGTSGSSVPTWNATIGSTTQDGSVTWTNRGTPANWKYISNVPAGDAQAYLSDGTVGDVEMYSFNPVTGPGVTVIGVNIRAWKDQTYACSVRGNCTSGGVTADNGSDLALPLYLTSPSVSGAPADLLAIFETDTATGAQWSGVAAVNAASFGVKVTAA